MCGADLTRKGAHFAQGVAGHFAAAILRQPRPARAADAGRMTNSRSATMWKPSAVGAGILVLVQLCVGSAPAVAQSPVVHAHLAESQAPPGLFQPVGGYLTGGPGDVIDSFGSSSGTQGCDMTCDAGCQFPCDGLSCDAGCCDGAGCDG